MRQVNLLPEGLQRAEKERAIKKSIIATISLTFLVILSIHLLLAGRVRGLEGKTKEAGVFGENPEISQLQREVAQLKREERIFVGENIAILDELMKSLSSPYILKGIGDVTSQKVWLTGLSVDGEKRTCQIQGSTFKTQSVSEFMFELKKLAFFTSVDLASMETETESDKKEVDFKIICNLR